MVPLCSLSGLAPSASISLLLGSWTKAPASPSLYNLSLAFFASSSLSKRLPTLMMGPDISCTGFPRLPIGRPRSRNLPTLESRIRPALPSRLPPKLESIILPRLESRTRPTLGSRVLSTLVSRVLDALRSRVLDRLRSRYQADTVLGLRATVSNSTGVEDRIIELGLWG